MTVDLTIAFRRELARRVSGGIDITLFWNPVDESVSIEIWNPATDEIITFAVAPDLALDAFTHPFAHLAPHLDLLMIAEESLDAAGAL